MSYVSRMGAAEYMYLLAGVIFIAGVGLLLWFWHPFADKSTDFSGGAGAMVGGTHDTSCTYRSVLNGVCVQEGEENVSLVGVMIENHIDARPQAGLVDASVVYEAPVEANITRFFALYPLTTAVSKVGPVRSARPYYLDWFAEYDTAMYLHVGGSPDALAKIDAFELFAINEMTRGWYFWRSDERLAPHNTYTSQTLWKKAWNDYAGEKQPPVYDSWVFTTSTSACAVNCVDRVTVSFAAPAYEAEWRYTSSTGQYERYQSGRAHRDEDGRAIVADTVIVEYTNVTVLDEIGRRGVATTGSGSAKIFRDGYMIEGSWEKRGRSGRTQWFDNDGNEIPLRPGKIWIEVVGGGNTVTTKNRV